ncbi:unnamed protein product [Vitrella brassicaformis CCMP3155]|uniref:Uncharacterized protein n=1 Tax=Vitrella brassicaformis (strain CCMP3155) TaxID=1169540 RepID=A0A0G4EFF2_VITBC|nr:unnamed protein product [Vitrella brassicaformis CCMP3155]|eukprot:CEL94462.1 unnamed protein product [Vitrella brassicaformis CCMP3155]
MERLLAFDLTQLSFTQHDLDDAFFGFIDWLARSSELPWLCYLASLSVMVYFWLTPSAVAGLGGVMFGHRYHKRTREWVLGLGFLLIAGMLIGLRFGLGVAYGLIFLISLIMLAALSSQRPRPPRCGYRTGTRRVFLLLLVYLFIGCSDGMLSIGGPAMCGNATLGARVVPPVVHLVEADNVTGRTPLCNNLYWTTEEDLFVKATTDVNNTTAPITACVRRTGSDPQKGTESMCSDVTLASEYDGAKPCCNIHLCVNTDTPTFKADPITSGRLVEDEHADWWCEDPEAGTQKWRVVLSAGCTEEDIIAPAVHSPKERLYKKHTAAPRHKRQPTPPVEKLIASRHDW